MRDSILDMVECGYPRESMCANLGISDRELRRIIAEECPEIGQRGNGYYICKSTEDYEAHEKHLWSRVQSLMRRIRRVREARLDLQHSRQVSDIVRSWVVVDSNYNEVVR